MFEKIIYTKFSNDRAPSFRIMTQIIQKNEIFIVRKSATDNEAIQHINNLLINEKKLSNCFKNSIFCTNKIISHNENYVDLEYVDGLDLTQILDNYLFNKDLNNFQKTIDAFFSELDKIAIAEFHETQKSVEVFGEYAFKEGEKSIPVGNIDLIFQNIILTKDNKYCNIDYEWVFDFPIPVNFLKWRALFNYFAIENRRTSCDYSQLIKNYSLDKYENKFVILETDKFRKFVNDGFFSKFVHNNKKEEINPFAEINNKDAHIKQLIESERNLKGKLSDTEAHVEQLLQSEHNQNMRIVQLESQIQELDAKINEYNVQLNNKTGHIQQLILSERELNSKLQAIYNSKSYKLTAPLRFLVRIIKKIYKTLKLQYIRKAIRILRYEGAKALSYKIRQKLIQKSQLNKVKIQPLQILNKVSYNTINIPNFKNPLISIVIPVFNQFDYTYKCIVSILNTVHDIPFEIIIGDDMSIDKTKNIEKYFPGIKVNINKTDHGFLMNCNRAAKHALGKYILFLNNDTQVQNNWLSSLLALIESDEKIGMVGSKLVYPDGRLQEAGGIIWSDGSGWNYGREQNPDMPEYNYVKEVDYISGASIMIRKSLWEEIGGFDECYKPAYCEDSDLAFEVRRHGYKVMYQPASVVVHFEGVSNGKDINSGLKKYQIENHDKLVQKWNDELKKQCQPDPEKYLFYARERSSGKKVVLIIDHYVPTFDKDAGSKTTFQYIKMFIAKGFNVKFVGDNFAYKEMEPYMSTLLQLGVEVLYGAWYAENFFTWLDLNKEKIDFVYLNRPHISIKYIDYIKKNTNIKIIYYGHDLHFMRMQREYELNKSEYLKQEISKWKDIELNIMRKSDVVYYPSYLEEQKIKEIDSSINVKAINAYIFDTIDRKNIYEPSKRNGILFVGGFSHTPNVDAVIWFASKVYPHIRSTNPNIDFYIVGSNAPYEIKKLNGNGIIFKGFVSEEELANLYNNCKIVVVPLRYGAGVKGKVVEALYNGCPIITTDIGAEGISGIENVVVIKNEPEQFANSILELYENDQKLIEMSQKSIDYINENFSINAAWNIIKDDFML